ncbi:PspC domain-containing protein [Agromyces sp. CFH 90414]|uniref:PspC domain-containing protein n=1 Tax=Agromyces agglutinans TaxID=2662258 RepID=A0A6I2F4J0_9MICO|nr:PspC domain-containing protein [Agromyces agglutinans]MRG59532.1 PspC domain-containing protein [Agromyces agglutinans]
MAPTPTTPPPSPEAGEQHPPAAPPSPPGGTGFFDWVRTLDVPRRPGWIGGVAAGVAAKLNIDPVIVRGVLVVFALFGAPAFVAYGVAWLLLPDERGRIHLEQVIHGVWDRALVGIGLFLLVGVLPWGGWWATWNPFWDGPGFNPLNPLGLNLAPIAWTIFGLAAIAAFVVWVVRRVKADVAYQGPAAPATPGAASAPASESASASDSDSMTDASRPASSAAFVTSTDAPVADPLPPTAPAPPTRPVGQAGQAGTAEYDAWRTQYDAWRLEHDAWKRSQAEANRAARARVSAENRAQAVAFQAQAEEARRIRRLTRPRTSFPYVVATLGAGLLAGAAASIAALASPEQAPWAVPIGLAATTLVVALSMVLAGILRRRSGFLAFATVVLLVATLGAAAVPRPGDLVIGGVSGPIRDTTLIQPVGSVRLALDAESAAAEPSMEVVQGAGTINVEVRDGVRLELDIQCGSCSVSLLRGTSEGWESFDGTQLTAGVGSASSWHRVIGRGLQFGDVDATLTIRAGASRIELIEFVDDAADHRQEP